MKRSAWVPILFLLFSFGLAPVGYAIGPEYEEIAERVTETVSYTIDEEIRTEIPIGEATRFNCSTSLFDLKDYIVFPARDGLLWICYLDTDGNVIDRRATDYRKVQGSLQPVADYPCLAILKWVSSDKGMSLSFLLSTDKDRNGRERDLSLSGRSKLARGSMSGSPFPPNLLTETDRIAGFAQLWSEVKFNFAFFDQVPDLNWDETLIEYLPRIQKAESIEEYYRTLQRCVALLHDGHTNVYGPGIAPSKYRLPLEVQRTTDGKSIIVGTYAPENIRGVDRRREFEKAKLALFEEITHIDGRTVDEYLSQEIYSYLSASTTQARDLLAYDRLLKGEYNSKVTLGIRDESGNQRSVTLTRGKYPSNRRSHPFEYRELEDNIAYVSLPSFGSENIVRSFESVFPKIRNASGLILDVRYNGGGSTDNGYAIISLLTDKVIPGSHWKTRMYLPAFRAWDRPEQWFEGEPSAVHPTEKDPYLGPIVVLTGPRTFSAAEDFVVALHASKRAIIVGQRTGGSTGQPLMIQLPGGGRARICTKRDTYPDGRDFVGVGVIPDVEISLTREAYISGEDVVLNRGIEVVQEMMPKE